MLLGYLDYLLPLDPRNLVPTLGCDLSSVSWTGASACSQTPRPPFQFPLIFVSFARGPPSPCQGLCNRLLPTGQGLSRQRPRAQAWDVPPPPAVNSAVGPCCCPISFLACVDLSGVWVWLRPLNSLQGPYLPPLCLEPSRCVLTSILLPDVMASHPSCLSDMPPQHVSTVSLNSDCHLKQTFYI